MRLFSPFAILGLLHVARGGELDSFSGDRARHIHQNLRGRNSSGVSGSPDPDSALSAPGSLDLPPAFRKAYERSELHKRVFDQIDADGDGHIIADDVLKALEFWWDDAPTVRRILRTFGIHDIDGAFENETTREKRMSKPEFLDLAERSPVEGSKQTSHCPALKDKIESCDINGVIKCSKYLQAAQAFCRVGQRNIIETCIMSESCSNVCDCISAAENAVDGKAVLVDQQGVNILQHPSSLGHHEQGLQPRFWFIAFLVALFAVDIALIIKEVQRHDAEVAWLDTKFWDGSASPPACSVYVYWGSCAYIWDSKSKECPGGGQRVYGNSCKDHFRYGSKGCGALDAKCQSLCTKTNPNQCPCDIFDWTDYVDQDMPGADLPNSSFFTQLVSDCRSACAKRADCKAFVLTPPKGNKDDKSHNCWLKSAQRPTQRSDGAVTFFRKGDGGNSCGKTIPITTNGAYNGDWWPEGSTKKRDSTELVPRGAGDKVPFLFNPRDELFYRAARLIEELYRARINNDLTWQRHQALRGPIGANEINRNVNYGLRLSWHIVVGRVLTMKMIASNPIYVSNATLPAWNPVELGYRIRAVFNSLFDLAANRVDNPVIQYLANTPSGTDAEYAMFPRTVRELLESNARTIHAPSRDINDIWIGTGRAYQRGGSVPPYANIEVGYDQRLTYWQGGNAGPFSLEAAFILATQVAGVNFNNLARAVERSTSNRPRGDPWWMGVMTTDDVDPTNMYTEDSTGCQIRQYGRTVRSSGSAQHDTDAGVYMAFDLDPNLAANSTNRNVFVFVVHAIDRSAVIQVPQDRLLRQVALTRYTPSTTGRVYNAATPNGGDAPRIPTSANDRVPTRVFAHAHAAIVPLQNLQDWLQSFSGRFPIYDQIGASHFYILTEDDVIFPRRNWRRDNGGSGSS